MASLVQLQTLITRVRQRANIEGANAFITDAEITDCLNQSYANEVYDLLRQFVGEQYLTRPLPYTFLTQPNVSSYPQPADLLSLTGVDIWLGGNAPISGRRYSISERNKYRAFPFGWNYGSPVGYTLQGPNINFLSVPTAAFQVDLYYVPVFKALVELTDTLDDVNGWSEIAVLDAAIKCLIKEGSLDMANFLEGRKAALVQKVKSAGPNRHANEPEQVNQIAFRSEWGDGWLD